MIEQNIVVTTGIYDIIKDHIRRKKVTQAEEKILTDQLRNAKQVLRRDLPADRVTVNRKVTIKDHTMNEEKEYLFVSTTKAKPKKNKYSILSDIALSTVGCKVGDQFDWPFREGNRTIEILKVESFES